VVLPGFSSPAEVRIYIEQQSPVARVRYECTAGEIPRAFALNVVVSKGSILGISDYFKGPSTAAARGYGFFPAAYRKQMDDGSRNDAVWERAGYTPLAVFADAPNDTLAGLGSSGVTLEFGGLWDPEAPATVPSASGLLCSLRLSTGAMVTIGPNSSRGGVVSADPNASISVSFSGAFVQPPEISSVSLKDGMVNVSFSGGELETAPGINGPWTVTGDMDGEYSQEAVPGAHTFYRVRGN